MSSRRGPPPTLDRFAAEIERSHISRPRLDWLTRSILSAQGAKLDAYAADWSTAAQTYDALASLHESRLRSAPEPSAELTAAIRKVYDDLAAKQRSPGQYIFRPEQIRQQLDVVQQQLAPTDGDTMKSQRRSALHGTCRWPAVVADRSRPSAQALNEQSSGGTAPPHQALRAITSSPANNVFQGNSFCSACHSGQGEFAADVTNRVCLTEYKTWNNADRHAHAYASLSTERGQRIGKLLGKDVREPATGCVQCHTMAVKGLAQLDDPQKRNVLFEDGVSCEACHGPSSSWMKPHFEHASWQQQDLEQRTNIGLDRGELARHARRIVQFVPPGKRSVWPPDHARHVRRRPSAAFGLRDRVVRRQDAASLALCERIAKGQFKRRDRTVV